MPCGTYLRQQAACVCIFISEGQVKSLDLEGNNLINYIQISNLLMDF
jgi:hypothetical protein